MSENRILPLRRVPYKDSGVPANRRMQYLSFRFFTNIQHADSPSIPFGVVLQLQLTDGIVLCGIGRNDVREEELIGINLLTWGDAFENNSTVAFMQKFMIDSSDTHARFATPLDYLYGDYMRTNIHSRDIYEVPAELLATIPIHEATSSEEVSAEVLRSLLQELLAKGE